MAKTLPSTVRDGDRGNALLVFQGLCHSLSKTSKSKPAKGRFWLRIDPQLLDLQVFFHRKVGKPENIQAFIQNEEVLAGFQQISRPYTCAFAGKYPQAVDFDRDCIKQGFRSQRFVRALDPLEGI